MERAGAPRQIQTTMKNWPHVYQFDKKEYDLLTSRFDQLKSMIFERGKKVQILRYTLVYIFP